MSAPVVVLSALAPGFGARRWSSATHLRIGRLPDQDVQLDDGSVSRRHAEVVLDPEGWFVRDLGSANGTYLNEARIGRTAQRVRQGDVIKIGDFRLQVDRLAEPARAVPVGSRVVHVQATARRTWNQAVDDVGAPAGRSAQENTALLRLMREGYTLSHAGTVDAGLQKLLDEAISYFGAQRGGILFPAQPGGPLVVRCVSVCAGRPTPMRAISRTPAARAFAGRESVLFRDVQAAAELAAADSVARGGVASVVCAVIRSRDQAFGVFHLDRGHHQDPFTEADLYAADSLAAALAVGVEREQMAERQQELLVQTVTALAQAVEMRDVYTGGHTSRVTAYALLLAEEADLPDGERQLLRAAAALHDIGKIAIDDHILRKAGRLTDTEFDQMRTHVTRGAEILETVPALSWALPVVRSHHERWDGLGYPDGLKGEDIPLAARVVAVADAFDAMTSDRPYRRGMPADAAFAEIRAGAGRQFYPDCAAAFVRIRGKIEAMLRDEELSRDREGATNTVSVRELRNAMLTLTPTPVATPAPTNASELTGRVGH